MLPAMHSQEDSTQADALMYRVKILPASCRWARYLGSPQSNYRRARVLHRMTRLTRPRSYCLRSRTWTSPHPYSRFMQQLRY
ncbi:hypothetical protein PUN4_180051 [Paraburkholderia unamae]|nr:hypothetical protein PUN4_180051 [Paraburkholderia unamae]